MARIYMPKVNDIVRLKHAPLWFGVLKSIFGNAAVVDSMPGSQIPGVGGWPLPIKLLEVVQPVGSSAGIMRDTQPTIW